MILTLQNTLSGLSLISRSFDNWMTWPEWHSEWHKKQLHFYGIVCTTNKHWCSAHWVIFRKKITKEFFYSLEGAFKVHIFWEGYKVLRKLQLTFVLCKAERLQLNRAQFPSLGFFVCKIEKVRPILLNFKSCILGGMGGLSFFDFQLFYWKKSQGRKLSANKNTYFQI